jgi:microsomal dipeptidase-like Zn-dependent dipeptidase
MERTVTKVDAATLHRESIVIDGLNASHFLDPKILERLEAGGVTMVHATVAAWHDLRETMDLIAAHQALFSRYPGRIMPVREAQDIHRAKGSGRVGVLFGFQGTDPIEDNLQMLTVYRDLGIRIMQLTYNATNRVGSGYRVPEDHGLTPFGREVIAEMNRLGILIDLSHCGDRTTNEAIEASGRPVAITHANSRRFSNQARNKSPETLRALAGRGGMVGAMAFPFVLTGQPQASLQDFLGAIEDLVDLVGIDRVGLGPDFMEEMPRQVKSEALAGFDDDTAARFLSVRKVEGFGSVSEFPAVTAGLLARGWTPENVQKVLGKNWLRFYEEAWTPEVPSSERRDRKLAGSTSVPA